VRPTMRFVAVKTVGQQAAVLLHRGRERLVRQRTGLVNALRAHLAEFGIIAPQGLRHAGRLTAIVRDEDDAVLPDLARQVLQVLAVQIEQLDAAVAAIEKQLMAWHKGNPVSQRLATIPGIGPIIATAIAATVVEPSGFRSGREFAAWPELQKRDDGNGSHTDLVRRRPRGCHLQVQRVSFERLRNARRPIDAPVLCGQSRNEDRECVVRFSSRPRR
jgi:transposase